MSQFISVIWSCTQRNRRSILWKSFMSWLFFDRLRQWVIKRFKLYSINSIIFLPYVEIVNESFKPSWISDRHSNFISIRRVTLWFLTQVFMRISELWKSLPIKCVHLFAWNVCGCCFMIFTVVLHSFGIAWLHTAISIRVLSVEAQGVALLTDLLGDRSSTTMRLTSYPDHGITITTNCFMMVFIISCFVVAKIGAHVSFPLHWCHRRARLIIKDLNCSVFYSIIYQCYAVELRKYKFFLFKYEWRNFPIIFCFVELRFSADSCNFVRPQHHGKHFLAELKFICLPRNLIQ